MARVMVKSYNAKWLEQPEMAYDESTKEKLDQIRISDFHDKLINTNDAKRQGQENFDAPSTFTNDSYEPKEKGLPVEKIEYGAEEPDNKIFAEMHFDESDAPKKFFKKAKK